MEFNALASPTTYFQFFAEEMQNIKHVVNNCVSDVICN